MKCITTIIIALITLNTFAQNDAKYKPLLKALNDIINNTNSSHWAYTDRFTVQQPFKVDQQDVLSVILRYTTDSSYYLVKRFAPVDILIEVISDEFIVLKFNSKVVGLSISPANSEKLRLTVEKFNYMHVGIPIDNDADRISKALQKIIGKLQEKH